MYNIVYILWCKGVYVFYFSDCKYKFELRLQTIFFASKEEKANAERLCLSDTSVSLFSFQIVLFYIVNASEKRVMQILWIKEVLLYQWFNIKRKGKHKIGSIERTQKKLKYVGGMIRLVVDF